jgi:hypothetical protein
MTIVGIGAFTVLIDGSPVLIEYGSAEQVVSELGQRSDRVG